MQRVLGDGLLMRSSIKSTVFFIILGLPLKIVFILKNATSSTLPDSVSTVQRKTATASSLSRSFKEKRPTFSLLSFFSICELNYYILSRAKEICRSFDFYKYNIPPPKKIIKLKTKSDSPIKDSEWDPDRDHTCSSIISGGCSLEARTKNVNNHSPAL